MRRALPFLALLTLFGCKADRSKDLVGTWKNENVTTTFTEDKKFTTTVGAFAMAGNWSLEGEDAVLKPETANGKPISELKTALQSGMSRVPAAQRPMAEGALKNIDSPLVFTLSADGKTLTTNKSKDKHPGPGMTLTKG